MKLTRRQEIFVQKMFDLKKEFDGPVHYSLLAERLGVSPFTAYDMLCLLEEKGYVTSEYQLPSDKIGPGRAERLFFPTSKANSHQSRVLAETGADNLEGDALKDFLVAKLRDGWLPADQSDLVEQMMSRLAPPGQGEVRYCAEVITIAALRLQQTSGWSLFCEYMPSLIPAENKLLRANLCLMSGFLFGLLAQQSTPGQEWFVKLREQLQICLDEVLMMEEDDLQMLASQVTEVFSALGCKP